MACARTGPHGQNDRDDRGDRDDQTMVVCSAHLESPGRGGASVTAAQVGEYLDLVDERADGRQVTMLAGDFNLDRSEADSRLVPRGYRSTVVGPTVSEHRPPSSRQIDMIYYGGPDPIAGLAGLAGATSVDAPGADGTGGTTYCDPQASDHCYVRASPAVESSA